MFLTYESSVPPEWEQR